MITTSTPVDIHRRSIRAMGCNIEIVLSPNSNATAGVTELILDNAVAEIDRLETVMSRFDPCSELSQLNRNGSATVSNELLEVIDLAVRARTMTAGRFDPTVREAMIAAGYDRSFEKLKDTQVRLGPPTPGGGGIIVDRPLNSVILATGVTLDLGAIGKGFAADMLASLLGEFGSGIINMGGDLRIFSSHDGHSHEWTVGVDLEGCTRVLALRSGGVATSGRDRRNWSVDGRLMHHVIDPTTGLPATTDLMRVTVVSKTAVEAEVYATQLLLAGQNEAREIVSSFGLLAVLVSESGDIEWIGDWNG